MANQNDTDWTDDKIATLRDLWDQGMSAKNIGVQIGVSKNAIVGKARRLDLPERKSPIIRTGPNPEKLRLHRRLLSQATLPPLPLDDRETILNDELMPVEMPKTSTLSSRDRGMISGFARASRAMVPAPKSAPRPDVVKYRTANCLWPIGEPGRPGFRFCDEPHRTGRSYCADHCGVAYTRGALINGWVKEVVS